MSTVFLNDDSDSIQSNKTEVIRLNQDSKLSVYYRKLCTSFEPFCLWNSSLKEIENKCGCVVLSYFTFISWLFKINLCMVLLQLSILVIPFMVLKPYTFDEYITDGSKDNITNQFTVSINCMKKYVKPENTISIRLILDILQGQGPLENSPIFLGYYFNKSFFNISSNEFLKPVFNTPVAYTISFWLCIIASFIITLYSSGESYKSYIMDDKSSEKFGICLFSGFDYGVTKQKSVLNLKRELSRKVKLQYDQMKENITRSLLSNNQLLFIYLKKILINLLFVAFLLSIYFVILEAQGVPIKLAQNEFINSNPVLSLLKDYVPSLTVAMINVIFVVINNKVVVFENYSTSVAVGVCLKRVIFVQAISLLIFMVTLLDQINQSNNIDELCFQTNVIKCWESYFGQQFYRFCILSFIMSVFIGPLFQLIRSLIYLRYHKTHKFISMMGLSKFDLSSEGFLLISSQCACWMGLWFCPFLSVIMLVQLFLMFYILKSMFINNLFETTMETSSVAGGQRFLLEMLLYSLAFIMLPVGYMLSNKTPSRSCSPFRIYDLSGTKYSFSENMNNFIQSLSTPMNIFWTGLTSIKTVLSLLALIIIITYIKYAQSMAYSKHIATLRAQIIIEEGNQLFFRSELLNVKRVYESKKVLSLSKSKK